jgi:iron(III) transport system substrate-binding protein
VFWNNELAHTVRLAQLGLLEPYASPAAATVPAQFRDKEQRWTAFAARARILVVNTDILKDPREWPRSIRDLGDPKWKGRIAIARPLTGTTLTHFTALRRTLGEQEFEKFFASLLQNDVRWLAGNGATLRETAAGKVVFALTDTDDYHVAKQKGQPVACVFPDQGDGQLGTMLIPNSVAVLKNCRHPEAARRLVDAILDRSNEATLAAGPSAQIPVRPDVPGPKDPSILAPDKCSLMAWDVEWTAANLAASSKDFATRFGM